MTRVMLHTRSLHQSLVPLTLTFALNMVFAAAMARSGIAAVYYVDNQSPTCSNSGAGTEAEPYCTISAAMAAHRGADITLIVKPGIYREQVTISASGAAGLPFVFQAQGPGVVIDAADDFGNTSLWTASTGTVFLAASLADTVQQVFVDGARLTPAAVDPALLPANSFTWVRGQGLYVNLGGDNPGTRQTLVGRRNYGFNIFSKVYVTMDGFEIRHAESRGINIQNGCTDLVISHNRVSFSNSYGIQTVNGQRIVIDGNVVSDGNFHGIGLTAGASGCIVRNNESFNNADPAIRRATGIYMFGAPGNTLYGNRLHHNQDTGMQFDRGSDDCISYNNRSWTNGDHGFDHFVAARAFHTNDVAYGNFRRGFSFENGSTGCSLFNSISVENGLTTDAFDLWADTGAVDGFTSNRNIFWNSTAQVPIKIGTTRYALIADFQLATGQDMNSYQADPRFANPAAGDFTLLLGSPAIDAGDSGVPNWPATDALGVARFDDPGTVNVGAGPVTYADMGALEFVRLVDYAPVVTCPSVVKAAPGSTVAFTVTAVDPDGDPITSLVMVAKKMPPNSGATFTPNATNTGGTFTWATGSFTGSFQVTFVASNALTGTAQTNIQIKSKGRPAIAAEADAQVTEVALSSGFPNPSSGAVEFALDLPRESQVRWAVFDLQGRMVWSEDRMFAAGRTSLRWDGMITGRGKAPTGLYLVRASVDGKQFTRRVVRL